MSAKNIYHDSVVRALIADGWIITHDPLELEYGGRKLYADLGAERMPIGAERSGRKIAVEIQSFLGQSAVRDLQEAVGQYEVYKLLLAHQEADRVLYLAVERITQEQLLKEPFGQFVVASLNLRVIVFDAERERLVQWIESSATETQSLS